MRFNDGLSEILKDPQRVLLADLLQHDECLRIDPDVALGEEAVEFLHAEGVRADRGELPVDVAPTARAPGSRDLSSLTSAPEAIRRARAGPAS